MVTRFVYDVVCNSTLAQGQPMSQRPRTTFLTVLPQRATSWTWVD